MLTTSGTLAATVRATGYAPTVQYNFQSSEGIYQSNGPPTFGGTGLKGMGTASYTNPNGPNPDYSYVLTLSGSADTSYTTAAQLAPFINTDIPGYFLFDEPGGFLSYNANILSYDLVSSTASGSGSITYFYMPLGGALPEPATWAMLIVGVGAVGTTLRRRRARVAVSYA